MLSVVICDDEFVIAEDLMRRVLEIMGDKIDDISVFASRETLEDAVREGQEPDIALLDIQLQQESGIELARELFPEGSRTQVIFVTGFPEYHTEAYEAEHIYFLLKPVDGPALRRALQKAERRLARLAPKELTLTFRSQTIRLPADEIWYIESMGRKVIVHREKTILEYNGTLNDLEERMPAQFLRCHKSFFVNLDHVEKMETSQFVLRNGQQVPISQLRRGTTRQLFLKYLSEKK